MMEETMEETSELALSIVRITLSARSGTEACTKLSNGLKTQKPQRRLPG
jgi:hypothetical protein